MFLENLYWYYYAIAFVFWKCWGWARASCRLGMHSYIGSTLSSCRSMRWREVWGAVFIKLADTFSPVEQTVKWLSEQAHVLWVCSTCLSCQNLKTEQTHIKLSIPRSRWCTPTCCLPSTASTAPFLLSKPMCLLPVGSLVPAVSSFASPIPDEACRLEGAGAG